jgi:hypothetical protein
VDCTHSHGTPNSPKTHAYATRLTAKTVCTIIDGDFLALMGPTLPLRSARATFVKLNTSLRPSTPYMCAQ